MVDWDRFADFSDKLHLAEFDLLVHDNDSDVITDLDEIRPSILLDAVDNITQELAWSFPDSLLVRLGRGWSSTDVVPMPVCYTAQLGVKDF